MKNILKVMVLVFGMVSGIACVHATNSNNKLSQQEILMKAVQDCAFRIADLAANYPDCMNALYKDTDTLDAILDRYVIQPYRDRLVGVVDGEVFVSELTVIVRKLAAQFMLLV